MARKWLNRYTRQGLRRALFAGASAGVLASAALAQVGNPSAPLSLSTDYLGYAVSVSPRVTASDNIGLVSGDRGEDDVILSTMFTAGAIISTQRVTAIALGDLDFSYLTEAEDFVVNQNVGLASTFTVADNFLYFDASGQSSRQLLGDNARFSGNVNAARNQSVSVHSFTASPYIYHRLPDQSTIELRYRYSQVFIDDVDAIANRGQGNFLNDSISHEAIASYESGGLFDRMQFRLVAYGADANETGSDQLPQFEYEQGSLLAEAQYALTRTLFVSGAIGYDEINTQGATSFFFDEDDLSGVLWRAGITLQPGRRSNLRVEYGERYGDDFIDAELDYALTQRIAISGGASRAFRSRAQGVNTQFRETQTRVLDFADILREGRTISPRGVIEEANDISDVFAGTAAQTIGVSVTDTGYLALSGIFGQTRVSIGGVYDDADFGFRTVETYGGTMHVNHRFSRPLTAYGSADFRRADTSVNQSNCQANPVLFGLDPTAPMFDPVASCSSLVSDEGRTNTLSGRIGLAYQIYDNVSLFGEYSRTERFSPIDDLEYSENTGTIGLTLDF